MASNHDPCVELENLLRRNGLHSGLRFLNHRVEYRFTAVFRLEHLMLHSTSLVDKVGGGFDTTPLQQIPLGDSFCQFVMRDGQFKTSKTSDLPFLNGHPYQGVLESYVGLPLVGQSGQLYGTFCHFDFAEKPISDEEFAFLQQAARLLPQFLQT
jgi:GAF domain-containing protein